MYKFLLLFAMLFSAVLLKAQTFTGAGGVIADASSTSPFLGTTTCFPITVTGVGSINGTYGLESVCINLNHTYDGDLFISLVAPNGLVITLSNGNGTTGDNYTNTCFNSTAILDITDPGLNPPYTGSYLPEGALGTANNNIDANGVWQLCVKDSFNTETGSLLNWNITFSNNPAIPVPPPPVCTGNPPAGNTCTAATPVCNFNGYCGNTSSDYTVDTWPELTDAFCGTINNNSFVTFVASAATASFSVYVTNSRDDAGIQMMIYDGGCGSGPVNAYVCNQQMLPSNLPTYISASGLTPGNTYYLMIDGFNGDVCDYSIAAVAGVNVLNITPPEPAVCPGQSVTLTAAGGNGVYSWSGTGLSSVSGAVVIATPAATTTYTVTSIDPTGSCPITTDVTVTISSTPSGPAVTSPVNYCQGSTAVPLAATGTGLLWFTAATGGTGSATAPTPSTATVGSITYYVSQTLASCGESIRVPVVVNIGIAATAPVVSTPVTYCQGATAIALGASGTGLTWYSTATGGTGTATAPVPSTVTAGSTIYYVTQTIGACESPRAAITVTVTSAPAAPVVSTPVTFCQGSTATPLSATGTNLLWYTVATGGTGNTTAPTPSTITVGTATWYVSQASGSCRGPRAAIVVNVVLATPPPVTAPVTYCQGVVAPALTATGSSLLWYVAAAGGSGNATAPTPSTATIGSTTYYVTQTLSCGESVRQPLVVNITTTPAAPGIVSPVIYCQGATASQLTATGSGLLWYTTASGGTGSASAPIPATSTTGNTNYYVSQSSGACEGPKATIAVTVNSIPAAPAVTSTLNYCQNATATALSATGTGLLWYSTATGGTGVSTAPVPATSSIGTITYYVSQAINGCESPRSSIAVTILIPTSLPAVSSPIVYCQGSAAAALTATGTGLLWYTAATGGTGSATAPVPSTTSAGSTSYYVSQTAAPCGESGRAAIIVNITSTPAIPVVTSPVIFCQGANATPLTATGTGLLWYSTATGGTGISVAPIPSTASVGSTIYYVSQSTGSCEGPRASLTVTVNSIPAAPAVGSVITYCQGVSTTALTATGSNLLWYTSASGGTGNPAAPTPSSISAGTFNYFVSQTFNGCEGPRSTLEVVVLPYTAMPVVSSPIIFCQGTTAAALTATGNGLLWYSVPVGGTAGAIAPVPSTIVAGTFTYYVTQTGICGESARQPIVVNINPIPAPPLTTPATFCQLSIAPLTAGGTNLLWYAAPTGGTGVTSLNATTTSTGNYTYYVSQTIGGCESPRAALVTTIFALPPAPTGSGPYTYCQGASAGQLTATGSSLLWYSTPAGGTGNAVAPVPNTNLSGDFTYYVTQTLSCGESPRTAIQVKVNSTPVAPSVTSSLSYCQGTAINPLLAGGTNLLWYTAASGGVGSTSAPTPSGSIVGNTSYYVSATTGVCEGPRALIQVQINPTPAAPAVTGPFQYCQDAIVPPLTATGTSLLWYTTSTGGTASTQSPVNYSSTSGNSIYYVSQTTGVCEGPRASITVTINPYPNLGPNVRDTVCAGDSVDLPAKFNLSTFTVKWTLNGEPVSTPSAVKVSGAYQLEALNTVGCADTVLIYVTVQPVVTAFAGNDTLAVRGVPHQMFASGAANYLWSPSFPLSQGNIANPLATLTNDQQFVVQVTDKAGCAATDTVFIKVYDGPTYYVPNAFSPNGDGLNDIFRAIPVGISYTEYFRVFNRFGQLVFQTNQWLKGWNGSFLGKKQPLGTYIWMVKGMNRDGRIVEMKGTVTIVQ